MSTADRLIHLDTLKTFSIIGVIFIHGATLFGCSSFFTETFSHFFRFCVPVFVIIWAYFLEKSLQKNTSQSEWVIIKKKLKHLFIVCAIWSILYFIIIANFKTLTISSLITKHFSGYGWAGQYYFVILFQLLLLFPLLRTIYSFKLIRNSIMGILILVYIYYSLYSESIPAFIDKLGDRPFYLWIPYVFVGIALARKEFIKIHPGFAFTILLIPVEFYFFDCISPYVRISILVSTTLLVAAIIQHPFTIKNNSAHSIFNTIGNNTMTLFVSNPLVILTLTELKDGYKIPCSNIFYNIVSPFISVTIILTLCLLIAWLIKKCKLDGILN